MCNADFQMLYSKTSHSLTISNNVCEENLEIIENAFFRNIIIFFVNAKKKFQCVRRHSMVIQTGFKALKTACGLD